VPSIVLGEATVRFLASTGLEIPITAILPMFFALSGFLVAGSLERCRTIVAFAGLRIIRIFPALAVEILLSAIVLGPLVTNLALGEYVTHPEFRQYFLNLVGEIHYVLPGVFEQNPAPRTVNLQLWTIPFELACYLCLSALAILGARKSRWLVVGFVVVTVSAYTLYWGVRHDWSPPERQIMGANHGLSLVWSFLWGVVLFQFRAFVPWNISLFLIAVTVSGIALLFEGYGLYLAPLALAYVTVYVGLQDPPRIFVLRGADISYGLFLYHWAVLQAVALFFPYNWVAALLIGVSLAIAVASVSWILIEKPVLKLKKPIMRADATGGGVLIAIALVAGAMLGFVLHIHLAPFL
jgi:peptidoglycan/LPS O-acetylase OafA/YrhL